MDEAVTDPDDPVVGARAADALVSETTQLAGALEAELAALEAALERVEAGGYGRCASCGAEIEDEVLAADPTATCCRAHGGADG